MNRFPITLIAALAGFSGVCAVTSSVYSQVTNHHAVPGSVNRPSTFNAASKDPFSRSRLSPALRRQLDDRAIRGDLSAEVIEDRALNPHADPVGTTIYRFNASCPRRSTSTHRLLGSDCWEDLVVLPGQQPPSDSAAAILVYKVTK